MSLCNSWRSYNLIITGFQTVLMETEIANSKSHTLKHTNKIRISTHLNRNCQLKTDLFRRTGKSQKIIPNYY